MSTFWGREDKNKKQTNAHFAHLLHVHSHATIPGPFIFPHFLLLFVFLSSCPFQYRARAPPSKITSPRPLPGVSDESFHSAVINEVGSSFKTSLPNPHENLAVKLSGNYPLATPERVAAFRAKQQEADRIAAVKKAKADELKARFEQKRREKEKARRRAAGEPSSSEEEDDDEEEGGGEEEEGGGGAGGKAAGGVGFALAASSGSGKKKTKKKKGGAKGMFAKHKGMFKQMSMVAMAAETMAVAAKHPEQKTKQSIKKLRASVNRVSE